jgi:hypothetical protein
MPDAGNGVLASTGLNIVGNNPLDANIPADSTFQQGWIEHLVANWHTAANGGLRYYILDNEPSIWHSTHRDVHPTGASMDEVAGKMLDYAGRIKTTDPSALVVGPEEWGWTGYFYSGLDQQYGNANGWGGTLPDRSSHGNADYIPYLLTQLQQHQTATGQRLLDVLSIHFYPQGGEYWGGTDTATEQLRNRSTRSLWDPTYTDTSWIGTQVQLIPRLKSWVSAYYPGTQTAITEYSWGADASLNGATAQADILGIFGRESLDLASRWTCPATTSPTYQAFKIYRNYDGANHGFGDVSVSAVAPSPDDVSAFAATRSSDGALTIMLIDKDLSGTASLTVNVAHFAGAAAAQTWQYSSSGSSITRLADTPVSSNALNVTLPAQSITLYILPRAAALATVRVPVTLGSYSGNTTTVPLTVDVRTAGTTTSLDHLNAYLSGGVLSFPTARLGTFDIAIQGPTFLRKVIKSVVFTASGATTAAVTLTNGDVNRDNSVGLPDYTAVTRALGATSGSANWNAAADLNGDGVVNAADLAIVSANLRKTGDQ